MSEEFVASGAVTQSSSDSLASFPPGDDVQIDKRFVFVGNIPMRMTNGEIQTELFFIFSPFGIFQVRATRDDNNRPIAFMIFGNQIEILILPDIYLGSRKLRLEY